MLLLAALGAAWLLPGHLDWSRYHGRVEAIASSTLGRPVTIEGPISLSLLPDPVLIADGVEVGGGPAPVGGGLKVQALRLRVGLLPLLAGRIAPRELVLHQPELHLPWPLPTVFAGGGPAWLDNFSARIADGRLTIGRLRFTGVEATLVGSDTGALTLAGTAQSTPGQSTPGQSTPGQSTSGQSAPGASGPGPLQDWHFAARLTGPGADGAQGLTIGLDGAGRASGLGGSFTGQIAADGSLDGRVAVRGPDLSLLLPAPPLPFRGEGRLTASAELAAVDDLRLELGSAPLQGAVALRQVPTQRLEIALDAARLDLDAWVPLLGQSQAGSLPVELDLALGAAELAGGTLRRLRASATLEHGVVAVRELSALLPGEADLHLSGRAGSQPAGPPAFEGDFRLDAPDLRTALGWAARFAGGPTGVRLPPDVLRSASLAGRLAARPGEIMLGGIQGRVDGTPLAGDVRARLGDAPSIAADLRFEDLTLDPWLPGELPPLAAVPGLLDGGALRVSARHARWHGHAIEDFSLDAASRDSTLVVHTLAGASQGLRATLAGSVGPGGRIAGGTLLVTGQDAGPASALLPRSWRATPSLWSEPLTLSVNADGPPQALALGIALDLGDGRLEARPAIDLEHKSWHGSVTLRHPGARRLLAAAGLLPDAEWLGDGSLSLIGQFTGSPGRLTAAPFSLTAGLLRANGSVALDRTGPLPRLSGQFHAETLPLPEPDLAANDVLPFEALRRWRGSLQAEADQVLLGQRPVLDRAAATLALDDAGMRLDGLHGAFAGGILDGSARLDLAGSSPALKVEARLTGLALAGPLTGLPIDVSAGRVEAGIRLAAEGYGPAALLATATGKAELDVADGTLVGLDLPAIERATAAIGTAPPTEDQATGQIAGIETALSSGVTPFGSLALEADIAQGALTLGRATLQAPAGRIAFAGSVTLPGPALDLRADLWPAIPDPPDIGVRLTGPLGSPRATPDLAGLARWLADHPAR